MNFFCRFQEQKSLLWPFKQIILFIQRLNHDFNYKNEISDQFDNKKKDYNKRNDTFIQCTFANRKQNSILFNLFKLFFVNNKTQKKKKI